MTQTSSKISVVLPSYNEKENIKEVIERVTTAVGKHLFEIIVVDDNSPDGTWKIVKEMNHPFVRLIQRVDEKGLASAIARGIQESQGDIIVWMDCDLGIPPEFVPQLVEKFENTDVAIASRYIPGGGDPRPVIRAFLSRCMNAFGRALFGAKITDYTSGIAAVQKNVIEQILWSDKKGFGEYFAEFSYRCIKNNLRIKEVPLVYAIRKGGVSKSDGNIFILLKYGLQYGLKMIKLRFTLR